MSWDWADGTFNRFFESAVGAAPAVGVDKTVMAVVKPRGAGFGPIGAMNGSSMLYGIFADSGKWFYGTDFIGGPSVSTTEWQQICARFDSTGTQVSWRFRNTTGGGASWDVWSTLASYHAVESAGTVDRLNTGLVIDRSNGGIAAAGVWSGQLADAVVDSLGVNLASWRALGAAKVVWQMNAISVPPVGSDLKDITGGGANGTTYTSSSTPQVSLAADPPNIAYYTPGGNTPPSSAFFQFLGV